MRLGDVAAGPQEGHVVSRIERVQDVSGFAALQSHWSDLLHASAADNPFLSFEWLYPWWKHLGAPAHLQMLAVWSGDTLIAVAPLMTCRSLGWLPRVEFLGT
jgi:CelD/BcsL family acetyltransferase involved in cellulose biosynthesis